LSSTIGELAALGTSFFFTATSTMFTLAGRELGSMVLNRARLVIAVCLLAFTHLLFRLPLPFNAGPERWFWLSISGVIGLVVGDAFLFQAFIWIGPRLAMLMMSLAPILASLLAWSFLGEALTGLQVIAILVTLGGVSWVVLDRNNRGQWNGAETHKYLLGILCGLGGAAGQAVGLITAKEGLGGDFPALSGTLIRMIAAALILWAFTFVRGQAGSTLRQLIDRRRASYLIVIGAFTGPFLGVTLSLIAIQRAQVGVASTLMALPPVFLLPVAYFLFKERISWRALLGTGVAIFGVGMLFLV
jgi:drug/metabolite transporter (DMT)-like permease